MEFFTKLEDRAAEQISGGKGKWEKIGEQPIPPGLYNNFTDNGKIPQGLEAEACGCEGSPIRGKKNGFGESKLIGVAVPPGLAK